MKNKCRILAVDDEAGVLAGMRVTLRKEYEIITSTSPEEALKILETEDFAVLISDMRMPKMNGARFLTRAREIRPYAVRMLLTGQADLPSAIAAINAARIFRFLTKPCPPQELKEACEDAVGQYRLQTAEKAVLEETVRGSVQMLVDVLALANPEAFGRSRRIKELAVEVIDKLNLSAEERWPLEMASTLSQLGAIALPISVLEKLYSKQELKRSEVDMVGRIPETTRNLLANIPRLESVCEILAHPTMGLAGSETPRKGGPPMGVQLLNLVHEYDVLVGMGNSELIALDRLQGDSRHDPILLESLGAAVRKDAHLFETQALKLEELQIGQKLAADVRTTKGALVISRGYEVSGEVLERLTNFPDGVIAEPLQVLVVREAA